MHCWRGPRKVASLASRMRWKAHGERRSCPRGGGGFRGARYIHGRAFGDPACCITLSSQHGGNMTALHGTSTSGVEVPHGFDLPAGRFGRMFPTLAARTPTGLPLAEEFGLPGGKLDGGQTDPDEGNPNLASGFTFLGQFIDHNITFDPTTVLGQVADAAAVTDF